MTIFATFGIEIIIAFVLMVIVDGLLMWLAAKIARVERGGFGRSMAAAVAASLVPVLVAFVLRAIPLVGDLVGFIAGLVLAILVIKWVLRTSIGKTFVVWIFYLVGTGVAVVLASMIMASSLLLSRGI